MWFFSSKWDHAGKFSAFPYHMEHGARKWAVSVRCAWNLDKRIWIKQVAAYAMNK